MVSAVHITSCSAPSVFVGLNVFPHLVGWALGCTALLAVQSSCSAAVSSLPICFGGALPLVWSVEFWWPSTLCGVNVVDLVGRKAEVGLWVGAYVSTHYTLKRCWITNANIAALRGPGQIDPDGGPSAPLGGRLAQLRIGVTACRWWVHRGVGASALFEGAKPRAAALLFRMVGAKRLVRWAVRSEVGLADAVGGGGLTLACCLEQALYVNLSLVEFVTGALCRRLRVRAIPGAWSIGPAGPPARVRSLGAKPSGGESGSLVGVHLAKAGARQHVCPR